MSEYTAKIVWKSDSARSFAKNQYTRGHTWEFDGGITVPASSSPHAVRVPFSVEAAIDPEEALVASASSCHMLTFLWLAAKKGFVIETYEDNAEGFMTMDENGKEWMSRIVLDPDIIFSGERIPTLEDVAELHHAAHEQCPIANSIKSDIQIAGIYER